MQAGAAIPITLLEMEEEGDSVQQAETCVFRYLWPTPTGLLLILIGYGVIQLFGYAGFLRVHFPLELGVMFCMFTAVVYAIRLAGRGRHLAPRWVFFVNFCFVSLSVCFILVAGILSYFSSIR